MKGYWYGPFCKTRVLTQHEALMLRVRKKFPRAKLKGVFDSRGDFTAWRIIVSDTDPADLSGHFQDDEEAWLDAAERMAE